MAENPFTPSFGEVPLHLAGRDSAIRNLRRAFASENRRPELTTAISGARGTGKTALLSVAANEAQACGWIAANVVAMDGMLEDILATAQRSSRHLIEQKGDARATGIGVGQMLSVQFDRAPSSPANWRSEMSDLLDELSQTGTGLLITVDEVQPDLDEMVRLAATYQLFVREGRRVALLMAGLPHNMSQLLQDKSVSFLRRAQGVTLGRLADFEVESATRKTVEDAGRSIGEQALATAVRAAEGFPYMMQLVGFRSWDVHPDEHVITMDDVTEGVRVARLEMKQRILTATYQGLSAGDRKFLAAMAVDEGESLTYDIGQRLGKSPSYVTQYKKRLLEQGVIGERGRGRVAFELPVMREFVLEQEE